MELRYFYWLIIMFSLSSTQLEAQGSTCSDIEPFCASDEALIWQNTSDGSTAEGGINYGCLGSQPNPGCKRAESGSGWICLRCSSGRATMMNRERGQGEIRSGVH